MPWFVSHEPAIRHLPCRVLIPLFEFSYPELQTPNIRYGLPVFQPGKCPGKPRVDFAIQVAFLCKLTNFEQSGSLKT
jgi:hypothetical protein